MDRLVQNLNTYLLMQQQAQAAYTPNSQRYLAQTLSSLPNLTGRIY